MAKRNRITLKEYFGKGKRPTGEQFADLVDSMLNIVDDGFGKSPEKGLLLSPLDEAGAVLEIRRDMLDDEASWVVALGKGGELQIHRDPNEEPYLTISKDGCVTLGSVCRPVSVQVNGSIRADSFLGGYLQGTVPADGFWHPVGDMEYTCRAYRVLASCGLKGKGRYALAEVTAMHCFGRRRRIKGCHSWFGNRFNRIQFRWYVDDGMCGLQVRTRSDYGEGALINYKVTQL